MTAREDHAMCNATAKSCWMLPLWVDKGVTPHSDDSFFGFGCLFPHPFFLLAALTTLRGFEEHW